MRQSAVLSNEEAEMSAETQTPEQPSLLPTDIRSFCAGLIFVVHCPRCQDLQTLKHTEVNCMCGASKARWEIDGVRSPYILRAGSARILTFNAVELLERRGKWVLVTAGDGFVREVS